MATKEFDNLDDFVAHMEALAVENEVLIPETLVLAGEIIKKKAKDKIGHLQEASGPYDAWDELADSTKKTRKDWVLCTTKITTRFCVAAIYMNQ